MKTSFVILSLLTVAFGAPTGNRSPLIRRQQNLQTFTAALGGIEATPVVDSGNPDRPFQVKGDTFVNIGAALQRSCDQQFNACANAANGGDATLSVAACSTQKDQCSASVQGSTAAANGNANGNGNANANQNANGNANANQNGNAVNCTKHKKRSGNKKNKRTSN